MNRESASPETLRKRYIWGPVRDLTETMAQIVLAYQFVDGLKAEIKRKLAGMEGTFEVLLSKARFEEARLRDVGQVEKTSGWTKPGGSIQNHSALSHPTVKEWTI